ncbi:hypothetical protein BASA60_008740 [Batrachochytrium salamandrivorans]|nr:hypothetical protein BASA60_008740 [Batrachochytrium salamandrivorans]
MRVDIGIVLSVLSFSVLAKVIPNDDSHGPLLVRRAVGPDTTDLLWKRHNGDDEQGPSPMDLDIGAEAGRNTFCRVTKSLSKTVIEKVTEVFEGENKDEFISEVETVLAFVLNSIRVFLAAYDSRATAPFLLFIPKGANRKSFNQKNYRYAKRWKKVR